MSDELDTAEFLDQFISTISHELRTPLSVVVGYAELLETRDDDETRREAALRIKDAAERLSSVIDGILMTAAIDAGTIVVDPVPVELGSMVEQTIARFAARGEERSLVSVHADGDGWPVVSADPDQLPLILEHLVSNACKYSARGGEVRIAVDEDGDFAIVSVSDDGLGISAEQRARLFGRFARLDSPERRGIGGTGLGLYIVRNLVEMQGGSVSVESEPGHGSTFSFTLPLDGPGLEE